MSTKSYLILCAGIAGVLVASLLSVPGFSDAVERLLLAFLAANAR